MSASAANTLDVRKKLRERARYEFSNNGYCQGPILTLANDIVGTGPRLQVMTENRDFNKEMERVFAEWSQAIDLPGKLRTAVTAKKVDGEPFALFTTNDTLPVSVQLDLRLVECDQVTDPWGALLDDSTVDGIRYDAAGNPVSYTILRQHPGDLLFGGSNEFDTIPARNVIHWFRADRPGQVRGIPEITAALPLFALLRRFTLATVQAAETAASFGILLQTQGAPSDADDQPEGGQSAETPWMPTFEYEHNMMTALPEGWVGNQMKAEHPATTFPMFVNKIAREIGRVLNMPLELFLGDWSESNFSSSRLAHVLYRRPIRVERDHCRRVWLEPTYRRWLEEAVMVPDYLPEPPAEVDLFNLPHTWYWPGFEYLDPQKDAQADTERLNNNTSTLQEILSEWGQDWEEVLRQRAREKALMDELGLTPAPAPVAMRAGPEDDEEEDEDEEEPTLRETRIRRNGRARR